MSADLRETLRHCRRHLPELVEQADANAEHERHAQRPFHPAVLRAPRTHVGWMLTKPLYAIVTRPEPTLQM
jgi:hypothetical protein